MKRMWISRVLTAAICLTGGLGTVVAQQSYYSQEISNCQQCYSGTQYQATEYPTYESASQPVYYEGYGDVVSYQPATVYQSPVVYGEQTISSSYNSTPVVSNTYSSGQVIYAGQTYSQPTLNTTPVVSQTTYSTFEPSSYRVATPAPVHQSAPVYQSSNYSPVVQTVSGVGSRYTSTNPQPGLAQQKARQAAQMSFRDHVGGSLGGANFEGVGWSNQSPQSAIQNCCYWGQKPPAQIGVSKSSDGCWYACVLYH